MVDPATVSADHPALVALEKSGAHPMELAAFRRRLAQLADPGAGTLPGDELSPVDPLPRLDDLPEPDEATTRAVLDRLAVVKLNGGLGTSMGLDGPKSTLEIKPGRSFLDVIAIQTLALRRSTGARLPLLLMDSPTTRPPSLERLRGHSGLDDQPLPLDFLQGIEPKLDASTLEPVEWPADPQLEWCPPGHGDIYTALAASGIAATLLEAGVRWCFVSNADNLGARPDPRIAAWLVEHEVPFLLEVVRGTESDRKGGHLAMRDGKLVLRESAQVPDGDPSFGDLSRWHYFNTNNIWFDLQAITALQEADPAAPELPLIVNRKTVDPTDKSSTKVLQLETAMGAAVSTIDGAGALEVPRTRFAPVKTTDDLLVARSDLWELRDDGAMVPHFDGVPPVVSLDKAHFGMLRDFEARFPAGAPSLIDAERLEVRGDVTFGGPVTVRGSVTVDGPRTLDGGTLEG
ncbi:UTP--glucose-1-phosphate uridylyltransferase [Actinomycetospora endophytica]|uniref:UTP--glucose-1-phosphate uridylyltransferase n=1 Tax=Actinomycetospora endophytica TaxID=2291215 RepID=A0ABS8PGL0_9PSEU|nr:UTP--glucose-1-phosphate uridylyltransferase [Actinomycetospora endophytica]MCD2197382.1 UTP--glucose-1-phosphate uridylyltransferase [Actinomycetospora endophytica]